MEDPEIREVTITLHTAEDPEIVMLEVAAIEEALMGHDESIWLTCASSVREHDVRSTR
jgi:hypothetical protein